MNGIRAGKVFGGGVKEITIEHDFTATAHSCALQLVGRQPSTCVQTGKEAYYQCFCGLKFEDAAGTRPITDFANWGVIPYADHAFGTAWDYRDSNGHGHQCVVCGAPDRIIPHTPGDEATETTPRTCKDCGHILKYATSHVHDLTLIAQVDPTCSAPGIKAHYRCNGCDDLFADPDGKKLIADHTTLDIPAAHVDTNRDNRCDVCGTELAAAPEKTPTEPEETAAETAQTTNPETEATQPSPTQSDTPEEDRPFFASKGFKILAVSTVGTAGGAAAVHWGIKRRRGKLV